MPFSQILPLQPGQAHSNFFWILKDDSRADSPTIQADFPELHAFGVPRSQNTILKKASGGFLGLRRILRTRAEKQPF